MVPLMFAEIGIYNSLFFLCLLIWIERYLPLYVLYDYLIEVGVHDIMDQMIILKKD